MGLEPTTRPVRQLLLRRGALDYPALEPVIKRMIDSPLEAVRSEGAAQAAFAALTEAAAQPLAQRCLAGPAEMRLGVARVYSQNLGSARYRAECAQALKPLFDDEDPEVRKAAAEGVTRVHGDAGSEMDELVEALLASRAFEENGDMALRSLRAAKRTPVGLAIALCDRALQALEAGSQLRRHDAMIANDISEVLMRAYVDAASDVDRNAALDVVDRALMVNAYGAQRALSQHDRG